MERVSKHNYYLDIAQTVAERSTCLRKKYGAIIVKNDVIVSTGYNGAPRGRKNCTDMGECLRDKLQIPRGERYELCRAVHAEANAIIAASREQMLGATLYMACIDAKTGELVTWEACQTFSGSWGYHRDEMTWKSPEMLIQMLINTVSVGGNLLMNVGPTSRGYLDDRAVSALEAYADWMKYNSRSIYGCTMAEPELLALCPNGCKFTQSEDGSRLYIHLFEYPFQFLELPGFAGKVDYAQFLHDGSELLFDEKKVSHFSEGRSASDDLLVIKLPVVKPRVLVPVIELFLK